MALRNYSKLRLRWALAAPFALLPLTLLFAQSSGYLTAGAPQKVVGKRSDTVEVKLPLKVQTGFHVNSNTPSEEYLIPLKLTWLSLGALEGGTVTYPKPTLEHYEFSKEALSVYTGDFQLAAKFTIGANAAAGPGAAVGKLRYQACSSNSCFPPKTIEIQVPYQVN